MQLQLDFNFFRNEDDQIWTVTTDTTWHDLKNTILCHFHLVPVVRKVFFFTWPCFLLLDFNLNFDETGQLSKLLCYFVPDTFLHG